MPLLFFFRQITVILLFVEFDALSFDVLDINTFSHQFFYMDIMTSRVIVTIFIFALTKHFQKSVGAQRSATEKTIRECGRRNDLEMGLADNAADRETL